MFSASSLSRSLAAVSIFAASLIITLARASNAHAAPVISAVTPASAMANVATTLSATVSASSGIKSCNLYVDLADVGAMNVSGNVASLSYTFPSGGARVAFVFCRDMSGGAASGPNTSIWVEGAIVSSGSFTGGNPPSTPPATSSTPSAELTPALGPTTGDLIKLGCTATADTNDPCKAVYYVGKDGKRHAFPNSKVYFTWYANFDTVLTVSSNVMGMFPLGKNVIYRPGTRLVKFTSLNNVYAVSKLDGLRWVTTESVATSLFGADWNTKIDDINDAFYGDYRFGSNIATKDEYSVEGEMNKAQTIDDTL